MMSDSAELGSSDSLAVAAFLARLTAGPAGLLIEGEPGIGKTTLFTEALKLAVESGFRVVAARAAPAETKLAFAAVADLLADVEQTLFDSLPSVQQSALNRILLRGDDDSPSDERVVAAAFQSVLKLLAEQSTLLVAVDDTQWLDPASRTVLSFALRRLAGPIGVLATTRSGDPQCLDPSWLQLARPEMLTRHCLRPLSLGALHKVIAARLGRTLPRPVITRVHDVSGGNPMYALELARTLDEHPAGHRLPMPGSLATLVEQRLATVTEQTTRLLLAAACLADATVTDLARATHTTAENAVEQLAEAERLGIIALHGNRVRFTHPLLSHGVYTRSSAAQRRAMHRVLAALTELPEPRARHLALAAVGADETTLQALDAAADDAISRGAPTAAAELIDLAIDLGGGTPIRRLRAAEQHFRAGSLTEAGSRLAPLIGELPPGALRTIALLLHGAVDGYGERFAHAESVLTRAITEAGDDPGLRLQGLLLLALVVGLSGDLGASVDYARRAVADADRLNNPVLRSQARALWVQVSFMYGYGTDEPALQTALALADPANTGPATLQAGAVAAINDAWTGRLAEARSGLAVVAQRCRDHGHEGDVVWAAEFATWVELWLGHYRAAADIADDAVQRAELIGTGVALIDARSCQAAVNAYLGRAEDARRAAHAAIDAARDQRIGFKTIAATAILAFLEVSLRDYEAALLILEPLLAGFDPVHGTEIMVGGYLPDAVEALVSVGRLDEAEPLVAALEANGARLDRPWMSAVGARGRAMLTAARGDLDGATAAAALSLDHHDRLPMPFERARTQLLVGQLERRRRRRQAAVASVTAALSCFESLGAALWAARARTELDHLSSVPTGASELTPAERRVAERAAAGMSNREIAAELFISPKTVEMNLSRSYRKLQIRSRSQLHTRLPNSEARENPASRDAGAS